MTFREKLAHVAQDDPDFARSARNWRIASWVFGVAVAAALGFAWWSLAIGFSNSTKITKIESPCVKYGSDSPQCEEAFSAAVATITHPQACAVERKAGTLRAIRELAAELGVDFTEPCAGARIEQERVRGKERAATDLQRAEGDAPQTGLTGHQQPGPRGGGQHHGSTDNSPSPGTGAPQPSPSPAPSSPPISPTGSSAGRPPSADPAPSSPPGLIEQTTGAAADTVDQAGKEVEGAIVGATCSLGPALCSK